MNGTAAIAVDTTMGRMRLIAVAALATAMLLAMPTVAMAANAYGQTFAGQQRCLEDCHSNQDDSGWQVGRYLETGHAKFVQDVENDPALLVPGAAKWPSPSFGAGFTFAANEIKWSIGGPNVLHYYITKYGNSTPAVNAAGQAINPMATAPADDVLMAYGSGWNPKTQAWEMSGKVAMMPYFQSCSGCHFLGVTRPSDVDYTFKSGATMTHSTETSYSGFGIQCEHCHGTGKVGNHMGTGVKIVDVKGSLDSQVCGQCHVNGTAKEKNYAGVLFGSANGYTPDQKLSDYFDVAGASYVQTSPVVPKPVIPPGDPKFYPNGSNKGMKHSYYNEWMLTPHARSLRWQTGELWVEPTYPASRAQEMCLRCHSGEAFLKSIGYGSTRYPNELSGNASSLATDELDIECGVCHQVHGKTGEPLGLRLSAFGPEATAEDLCAACHNSLGPIGAELAPGATPHHPHREMRNGYGLIGVPTPAKRFMEDTECPQCHMPTTKYALKTHSMNPMLPGNADAWGVQAGGDSCTPCHTSKTRADLQRDINEWAEDLEHLIEVADEQIEAAKSRPASTTAQGANLVGSAWTNVHFVEADGSHGAHNYPYAKAGLDKAAYFAKAVGGGFTRFGSTGYSSSMKMAMLYGTLKFGDGAPAAGEKVAIYAKPNGEAKWTMLGTATAGDDGDFGYYVGPDGTTSYKAVWSVKKDVDLTSAETKVTLTSATTANVSAATVRLGRSVSITGAVSPNHGGAKVSIQVKKGSGAWKTVATPTLNGGSGYSHSWRPNARSTYYVKTVFSGDAGHTGSTSSTRKVVVR